MTEHEVLHILRVLNRKGDFELAKPLAYEPTQGQMYQILVKQSDGKSYDHCDYAVDKKELKYLLAEYRMAFDKGCTFKSILLPQKYWK